MAITINLDTEQGEVLTVDYGLDTTKVYYIDNDAIGSTAAIGGYLLGPGAYMMFVDGTEAQQKAFMQAMFPGKDPVVSFKGRDIWLYETPASKHAIPENLITVNIAL